MPLEKPEISWLEILAVEFLLERRKPTSNKWGYPPGKQQKTIYTALKQAG